MAESGLEGIDEEWIRRQKLVFTNWINNKVWPLCTVPPQNRPFSLVLLHFNSPASHAQQVMERGLLVRDLFEDLKDGFVLYNLLEILSGQSLATLGKMSKGKMRIQHMANQNVRYSLICSTIFWTIYPSLTFPASVIPNRSYSSTLLIRCAQWGSVPWTLWTGTRP